MGIEMRVKQFKYHICHTHKMEIVQVESKSQVEIFGLTWATNEKSFLKKYNTNTHKYIYMGETFF